MILLKSVLSIINAEIFIEPKILIFLLLLVFYHLSDNSLSFTPLLSLEFGVQPPKICLIDFKMSLQLNWIHRALFLPQVNQHQEFQLQKVTMLLRYQIKNFY